MKSRFWSAGWWQQTIAPDVAAVLKTLIKSVAWVTVAFGIWVLVDRYILASRDEETIRVLASAQSTSQDLSSHILVMTEQINSLGEQLAFRTESMNDFASAIESMEDKLNNIDQTLSWDGYSIEWGVIKSVQPQRGRKTSQAFSTKFVERPTVIVSLKQGTEKPNARGGSRVRPGNGKIPVRGYYNCIVRRITKDKFTFALEQASREPSSYHIDMHWIAIGPVKP